MVQPAATVRSGSGICSLKLWMNTQSRFSTPIAKQASIPPYLPCVLLQFTAETANVFQSLWTGASRYTRRCSTVLKLFSLIFDRIFLTDISAVARGASRGVFLLSCGFGRKMGMVMVFVYVVGAWTLFHNWRWSAFTFTWRYNARN